MSPNASSLVSGLVNSDAPPAIELDLSIETLPESPQLEQRIGISELGISSIGAVLPLEATPLQPRPVDAPAVFFNTQNSFNTQALLSLAAPAALVPLVPLVPLSETSTEAVTKPVSHMPRCNCFAHQAAGGGQGGGLSGDLPSGPQFSGISGTGTAANIGGWLLGLNSGSRWSFSGTPKLTYSFYQGSVSDPTFGALSEAARVLTREIFSNLSAFINIDFEEVDEAVGGQVGDIRLQTTNESGAYAYAYYPSGGDVYLGASYDNANGTNGFQSGIGNHGYMTIIHEIGHALGLKHPGNYNGGGSGDGPFLSYGEDNTGNTVMSYNFAGRATASLMPFDILTLQQMYGARNWNTTDTTYSFTTLSRFSDGSRNWGSATSDSRLTIWDSSGVDTLNFAGLNSAGNLTYRLDLNEGGWNTFRNEYNNTTYTGRGDSSGTQQRTTNRGTRLAYGAVVENLVGSNTQDEIYGNGLANSLMGAAGNDTLIGGFGNDTLDGGAGTDTVQESGEFNLTLTDTSLTRDGATYGTPSATTVSSGTVAVAINDFVTATSNLAVNGVGGVIQDLNLRLNITHTFVSELQLTLISPKGTRMTLFARVGGGGDNFTNTLLDDEATTLLSDGVAPFIGSFRPSASQLAGFDGELANGTWQLEIIDSGTGDTGTLTNWSLEFTHAPLVPIVNAETDTLIGIEQGNLTGGSQNNVINAAAFTGAVTLNGGAGDDSLTGGAGSNTFIGFEGLDSLDGGAGVDTITVSASLTLKLFQQVQQPPG
jgi:subtilisin-like proprotein convertase family protein